MDQTHELELLYNRSLVRRSVRAFVRERLLGHHPRLWVAQAGLLAASATLIIEKTRTLGALLAVIAIMPAVLVLIGWSTHHFHKMRRLRAMGEPIAWLVIEPDGLLLRSGAGVTRLRYSAILALVERPGFLLLLTARNQFATLPTASIPAATLDTIRTSIRGRGNNC